MILETKEQALEYLNTEIKKDQRGPGEVGDATISQEKEVAGHKAWAFYIEGTYMQGNTTGRWLLDTGEWVDTEAFGNETVEKAYQKKYGKELV
jgi:hypothetical protein